MMNEKNNANDKTLEKKTLVCLDQSILPVLTKSTYERAHACGTRNVFINYISIAIIGWTLDLSLFHGFNGMPHYNSSLSFLIGVNCACEP